MTTPRDTPNPATSTNPERSSKRVAHKKPLGWLPWAALLGLLALLALVFLIINAIDDDGPDGPAGDSLGQVSGSDGSGADGQDGGGGAAVVPPAATTAPSAPTDTQPSQPATGGTGGTGGTGTDAQLKVGQEDLLALSGGSLADKVGQPVTGSTKVESVVSDEGFWAGSSKTERTFIYLTPEARKANGESKFQVKAGQTVKVTGTMGTPQSAPKAVAGVTAAEGLDQLTKQGALVSAKTVELIG